MFRPTLGVLLGLALAAAGSRAAAQYAPRPGTHTYHVSLGLGGGVTVPTGNSATPINTGYNGQAFILIHLLPGFPELRFNVGYSHNEFQPNGSSSGVSVPGYFGKSQQVLSGVGGLNLNLFHIGPVTPYITAGVGAFNVRTTIDTAQSTSGSGTSPYAKTKSMVNFGLDAGGGLALALGRVSAFAEAKVQNVYTNGGGLIKSSKHIMAVPVSAGIAFGLF